MKIRKVTFLLLTIFLTTTAYGNRNTEVIVCTASFADTDTIRSAVANLNNDVILLRGICQLDGSAILIQRSNLTIKGERSSGGDYLTIVRGLEDPETGLPISNDDQENNGFSIGQSNAEVKNIKIQDLRFESMDRYVQSLGGLDVSTCERNDGAVKNLTIKDNWFENSFNAIGLIGDTKNAVIQNNQIRKSNGVGVGINSSTLDCGAPDLTQIKNTKIIGNYFEQFGGVAINLLGPINTLVENNVVDNFNFSVAMQVSDDFANRPIRGLRVNDNEFISGVGVIGIFVHTSRGYQRALFLGGDPIFDIEAARDSEWQNNSIKGYLFGILILTDAMNHKFLDTTLSGNATDIVFENGPGSIPYLGIGPSANNCVTTTNPAPVVFDVPLLVTGISSNVVVSLPTYEPLPEACQIDDDDDD